MLVPFTHLEIIVSFALISPLILYSHPKISSTFPHWKHFICRNIIYRYIARNHSHSHMKETDCLYLIQFVANDYIFDFCCIAQYTFLLYHRYYFLYLLFKSIPIFYKKFIRIFIVFINPTHRHNPKGKFCFSYSLNNFSCSFSPRNIII